MSLCQFFSTTTTARILTYVDVCDDRRFEDTPLVRGGGHVCWRCKTILLPLRGPRTSYYLLSIAFTRLMCEIRSHLNRGILDRLYHRLNAPCLDRWWGTGKFGIQIFKSLTITGWSNNWLSMHKTWKPLTFLSHIKRRTNDDRFPLSLWEVWFWSSLGVPIPASIGPPQQCACSHVTIFIMICMEIIRRHSKLKKKN